jgi:hypothetical protein
VSCYPVLDQRWAKPPPHSLASRVRWKHRLPFSVRFGSAVTRFQSPQSFETGAHLAHEYFPLLKRSEVSSFLHIVTIDELGKSSLGPTPGSPKEFFRKIEQPTGIVIGSVNRKLSILSQHKRTEEAAVWGSQHNRTLSGISSRVSTFSGCPSQSVHAKNFSNIQASCPAGESVGP